MTTSTPPLPVVGERLEETALAPFDAAALDAYANASGDDNPLHRDRAVAKQAGFGNLLVHGMLVTAAFEPALAAWRADLRMTRMDVKFLQPLLEGQAARISGRVVRRTDDGILMRLIAQGSERAPAIIGEALLVPREAESVQA